MPYKDLIKKLQATQKAHDAHMGLIENNLISPIQTPINHVNNHAILTPEEFEHITSPMTSNIFSKLLNNLK